MKKYIYTFINGSAEGSALMNHTLGGKGANLAEMTNLGIPVPPGFTISTEVCTFYMKHKNLPDDIKDKSLTELTEIASNIIENLENEKDLGKSIDDYQKLIKLNNLIEIRFKNTSKEISNSTKEKILKILKKNEKKVK